MSLQQETQFKTSRIYGARIRRAIAYVREHIGEKIHLEDVAGAAALSPFHFSRAFKKATGLAPMRYVLRARIEVAKSLLADPDLHVATIAYRCGFASESHFCTAFKAATGMTTCQYRRTLNSQ